jgi:cytochrome b561
VDRRIAVELKARVNMAISRYDGRTIFLHWATVMLIIAAWVSGQTIDGFPKGPLKIDARSVHFALGILVAAVTACRLLWRGTKGTTFHGDPPLMAWPARAVKIALYGLIVAAVGLGLYNLFLRGDSIFNLVSAPRIGAMTAPARHAAVNAVTRLHGLCVNLILGLAGLHALAALFHRFVLKDQVFQRMWPSGHETGREGRGPLT